MALSRHIAAVAVACALAAGCKVQATFTCEDSTQCGPNGTCEPDNLCSFPDPSCPSGSRYGDYSGDLSGECVGASVSVGFQFDTSLTDELVGIHTVAIALSAPSTQPVGVDLAVTGGSADDSDFSLITPGLTIQAGETVVMAEIAIVDDGVAEPDELIELEITASTGAAVAAGDHTVTISSSPLPRVQFVLTASQELEHIAGTQQIQLTLDTAPAVDAVVAYGVAGTASSSDHDAVAGTIVIPAGIQSASLPVAVVNDTTDEYDETLELTLTAQSGAVIGTQATHVHTILDEDPVPTIAWELAGSSGGEAGGPAPITITLGAASGKTVTVDTMISGGTAGPTEYTVGANPVTFPPGVTSRTVTVTPVDDVLDEEDESVQLALVNATEAILVGSAVHTFAITDDDAPPILTVTGPPSHDEQAGTVTLMVTKSSPSERNIQFSVALIGGTASPADLTLPGGTVAIPSGAPSGTFQIQITADNLDEPNETFTLGLMGLTNGTEGLPYDAGIVDDDVTAAWSAPGIAAPEGDGGGTTTYAYEVSLNELSDFVVTVGINVGGSAGGSDRTVTPSNLSFAPGEMIKTVNVEVNRDNNSENDETITLTLTTSSQHVQLGTPSQITHTILDDD